MSGHESNPAHADRSGVRASADESPLSSRESPHPRAVLLDFHNTTAIVRSLETWIDEATSLLARHPASRSAALESLGNVWNDARQLFPTLDWDLDPAAHRHAFISTLSHDGAIAIDFAEALYVTMPNQWELNRGVADFIVRASTAGMRLAIVSNIALDIRPALEGWGIASALGAVVLSYEVGYVKPDPRIFQLAADLLDTDPKDCLMIGDSAHDDVGGTVLGMQCVITRPEQMWRALELASPR